MTTPQSLTEEQIELLRKIPPVGAVGYVPESTLEWQRLNREFHGLFMHEGDRFWRLHQADVLLATLQAERERERERVNGLAAKLLLHQDRDLIFVDNCGTDLPVVLYLGRDDQVAVEHEGVAATDLIAALESAANPLSPDVLGDQKDKGKAALTAPERDRPVEVSEPSAADGWVRVDLRPILASRLLRAVRVLEQDARTKAEAAEEGGLEPWVSAAKPWADIADALKQALHNEGESTMASTDTVVERKNSNSELGFLRTTSDGQPCLQWCISPDDLDVHVLAESDDPELIALFQDNGDESPRPYHLRLALLSLLQSVAADADGRASGRHA